MKGIHLAVAAFVLSLVLLLAVGGVTVFVLTSKSNEGSDAKTAICALTADLGERTQGTRDFLAHHPDGIPGLATASQLRESLHNQERTLDALSVVDCN